MTQAIDVADEASMYRSEDELNDKVVEVVTILMMMTMRRTRWLDKSSDQS